jgi:hypothetical protein
MLNEGTHMTPYQTLAVAVRLFAIWLCLFATGNLFASYTNTHTYGGSLIQMQALIWGMCIVIGVCGLIWVFPLFIAKRILPPATLNDDRTPTFDNWFTVGCSLIGVWALLRVIPDLISYVSIIYMSSSHDLYMQNPNWAIRIYYNAFELIMGIWLFLGGKGLRKILDWARS